MYEASKQCERANVPECFELTNLHEILKKNCKIIAFCERCAELSLHDYCNKTPIQKGDKVLVIIGPEGGFSQKEFEMFKNHEIPMLTLGDLILKAETAVTVALGNIIYEFENYRKN
jgi:16S rRNA (uracil1498-N3)-methyltransferase